MNKRRLLSLLLSAAMMVSTIPMTMATTVAAANKVELGDDALELATASVTGTTVNEDDGNKYLHVYNRLARNRGVSLILPGEYKEGVEYYLAYDVKGTFGNMHQRVAANHKSAPITLETPFIRKNSTSNNAAYNYQDLSKANSIIAAFDGVSEGSEGYDTYYQKYWTTFTELDVNMLVPSKLASSKYAHGASNSEDDFTYGDAGHSVELEFESGSSTTLKAIKRNGVLTFYSNGVGTTWKHSELIYIPTADRSSVTFSIYDGPANGADHPMDIDNIEVFTLDENGNKVTIFEDDFEDSDNVVDSARYTNYNAGVLLSIGTEGDYERISGGMIEYSDAVLTPGTYTPSGAVRIGNQADQKALASASATIVSEALNANEAYTITSEWTPLDYEFEVAEETELDLAFNFGTTEKVDLKGLSLVKTYEDTAIQIEFDPESTTVNAGGEVTANIVAKSAEALTLGSINFQVDCDNDDLAFVSLAASNSLETDDGDIAVPQIKNNRFAWFTASGEGITVNSDGVTLATVTYKATEAVKDGDVAYLSLSDIDVATTDLDAFIPYSTECAITLRALYNITIADVEYGLIDVEGDLTGIPAGTEITVDGATVTIGDLTLTALPSANYEFEAWTGVTAGELEGNLTIGATFKAASTNSTINVVGVDGADSDGATIENVVDTYGGLLEFTVVPAEGYIYEVSSDDVTLNDAGENKWQSGENLEDAVTVTVLVRKVDTVTIKANADAGLNADATYYIVEGKEGIYNDDYTTKVEALPVLSVAEPAEGATEKFVLPAEPYVGTTIAAILAGDVKGDVTIELDKAYLIKFAVAANLPTTVTLGYNEQWVNEGETPAYPAVTVENDDYYTAIWDKDLAKVTESTTYTVSVKAGSTKTILNYVDANETNVTVAPAGATVSDFAGEQLKVTPGVLAGYLVENVTADGLTFTNDGTIWTSNEVINAQTTVTITYREVIEVTFKTGAEGAVVTETKLYAKDNIAGLYSDEKCTVAVNALPAITYTKDTGMQWIPYDSAKPYVVAGTDTSAAAILAAQYTADTEITTNGVKQWLVTFAIEGGNVSFKGQNAPYTTWVTDGEYVTAPELVPAQYYTAAWDKDVKTTVNAAATYTAKATPMTFTFTATEGKVEATGLNAENKAVYGQAIELTFTLTEGEIVTLKIGDAEAEVITPDDDNTYTIAGDAVIGDIVVTVSLPVVTINVPAGVTVNDVAGGDGVAVKVTVGSTITIVPTKEEEMVSAVKYGDAYANRTAEGYTAVVNAAAEITFETYTYSFIEEIEYMGLAAGTRILVLGENVTENNTIYTLTYDETNSEKLYYSEKYKAYVAIVDDTYTAADLAAILTAEAGTAEAVNYDGDVNGDTKMTAGDAALVSDILHNVQKDVNYDDIIRLRADVDGNKKVTTTDATKALYISVGKTF